jgi:ribulose-phosphate 3-epimerase
MNSEIIPALLVQNENELRDQLSVLRNVAPKVHIDVTDGEWAGERSWPLGSPEDLENFASIDREERGMPFWEDFDYEFHLMVKNPVDIFSAFINAGAERIVVHLESGADFAKLKNISDGRIELGLALNFDTNISDAKKVQGYFDFIHLMSIRKTGYQRQEFQADTLQKVKEARETFSLPVSVDGGVSDSNILDLYRSGASRFVVGSRIFASSDPKTAYLELVNILHA